MMRKAFCDLCGNEIDEEQSRAVRAKGGAVFVLVPSFHSVERRRSEANVPGVRRSREERVPGKNGGDVCWNCIAKIASGEIEEVDKP